ncbi:MAG TPA: RNA polymerase sigma factor [Micropepsaceae bacterium]|nr:RNA polymerase sigma factor [Micropepsaceae bacterium]
MVVDPDGELVQRIAEGDAVAARALMARHLPRVLSLARRMLGNAADAEDVAQETFLRAWNSAARWRPGQAKFETWLHRVAINQCYDRLRKRRGVALDDIADPVDPGPPPGSALETSDTIKAVEAALARLPERQRAAIVLCHYDGQSNIAAAETLGISVDALESLLARGRRALREMLSGFVRGDAQDEPGSTRKRKAGP